MLQKINQIRKELAKNKIDGLLICSVANITYLTGYANFSQEEREAYLVIGQDFQYIITDGRYAQVIKKQVPDFELFERNSGNSAEKLFKDLKNKIRVLAIEEDELTVAEYKLLKKYFKTIQHGDLQKHRSIKTPDEIKKIEQAAKLGDQTFAYILKKIKLGISEKELAAEMEFFIKSRGADVSFKPIVAFGSNSSAPHHQAGKTVLGPSTRSKSRPRSGREGQFVLLDFGVKLENYCSDMTRTILFGQPNRSQKNMYQTVLAAQQQAVDYINSGLKSGKKLQAAQVDKIARSNIIAKGYPTIPHSLGHGIGLEVHEHPFLSPKSKDILKDGMVFSIEPGIYLPELGGVRIEDLFFIDKQGLHQLTHSPKSILSILS